VSSSLLDILKYFLVALIWLFFARVIRAVWVEIRRAPPDDQEVNLVAQARGADASSAPPVDRKSERRQKKRGSLCLEIVAPPERKGQIFETGDPDGELTLGRSPNCSVRVDDDNFASSVHARVFARDGRLWIEDLGSTNGTYVNAERIYDQVSIGKGDLVQMGETVFEVRTRR
jgi:hypothetical protein